ncbi:MAG: ferredoxin [Candidatus Omnitrophica bacterium]|nr:ferredoxin [Candidatus Omnitrophota bacterium]
MAKVTVDKETCVGCGLCVSSCPDCFEMTSDGVAKVKAHQCSTCNLHEIASQCPVNAITVED